jgi:hypothetical protein
MSHVLSEESKIFLQVSVQNLFQSQRSITGNCDVSQLEGKAEPILLAKKRREAMERLVRLRN